MLGMNGHPRHHPSWPSSRLLPQAGKQKGNTAVGRHLADAVAAVPHFTKADFEKMLADQQNDCTLVRCQGRMSTRAISGSSSGAETGKAYQLPAPAPPAGMCEVRLRDTNLGRPSCRHRCVLLLILPLPSLPAGALPVQAHPGAPGTG